MQIQSDLFGFKIIRPKTLETTAFGAAYLAGLAVGFWESVDEIQSQWIIEKEFTPKEDKKQNRQYGQLLAQSCKTFSGLDRRIINNRKSTQHDTIYSRNYRYKMLLILLGNGVVANVLLKDTKGNNSGWILLPQHGH